MNPRKQSVQGGTSFALAVAVLVVILGLIIAFISLETKLSTDAAGNMLTEAQSKQEIHHFIQHHTFDIRAFVAFLIFVPAAAIVGMIFGIIGLKVADSKRSYAAIGTVIHALVIAVLVLFIFIGTLSAG